MDLNDAFGADLIPSSEEFIGELIFAVCGEGFSSRFIFPPFNHMEGVEHDGCFCRQDVIDEFTVSHSMCSFFRSTVPRASSLEREIDRTPRLLQLCYLGMPVAIRNKEFTLALAYE